QLAGLVATARAGRDDLALLRLLARGIRNDDAAGGLFLGFDALDDHSIVQRTELGFRHGDLVAAQQRALGMIEREWAVSTQLHRVPKLSENMALGANCQARGGTMMRCPPGLARAMNVGRGLYRLPAQPRLATWLISSIDKDGPPFLFKKPKTSEILPLGRAGFHLDPAVRELLHRNFLTRMHAQVFQEILA